MDVHVASARQIFSIAVPQCVSNGPQPAVVRFCDAFPMQQVRRSVLMVAGAVIGVLAFAVLINLALVAELITDKSNTSAPDETITCSERKADMSDAQRRAAAADILAHARDKADGGKGLPDEALVDKFARAIDTACAAGGSQEVDDVAVRVYLNQRDTFRP